jgi:DNA-binding NtrC family response regulator
MTKETRDALIAYRWRGNVRQLRNVERELIERVPAESAGNKSRAARRLGLTRQQLYVRLRQYALEDQL